MKKVSRSNGKSIVLIRHGISEMNVALSRQPWGSKHFVDPNIPDAELTAEGRRQALNLQRSVSGLKSEIDLIVTSPLTRTLETQDIGLDGVEAPRLALPLAAERVYLSSDVGTPRSQLEKRFPSVDFSQLVDNEWWWTPADKEHKEWRPPGTYFNPGEPQSAFVDRMHALYAWLQDRPESTIALCCHWGVIDCLTGRDFDNCEFARLPISQMSPRLPTF